MAEKRKLDFTLMYFRYWLWIQPIEQDERLHYPAVGTVRGTGSTIGHERKAVRSKPCRAHLPSGV